MSFLAPWALVAGIAAALGVVALHLLTTRRPPAELLPTARFVPESDVRAVARASRPTDLLLLALRALAVVAIGAAFARPVLDAPGPRVRTVWALERSAGVADPAAAAARVRDAFQDGDALVVFDSEARGAERAALDSLVQQPASRTETGGDAPMPPRVAALSPMLVAARDAASNIARGADSVRLVVVTTAAPEGLDAATPALRAAWPGRIELARVAGIADTAAAPEVALRSPLADDPLAPALAALPRGRGAHEVRLVRGAASSADSAWVLAAEPGGRGGRLLVVWALAPNAREAPLRPDGVRAWGGVSGVVPSVVGPLARLEAGEGRVIARWRDGMAAATERALGAGCVRTVGIGLPEAGDLTLRSPFAHVLAALVAPCGGARSNAPPDSALRWFAGDGPLATGAALAAQAGASPLTLWLLIAASLLLGLEQLLRGRRREEPA
jgi:hypothetical protein